MVIPGRAKREPQMSNCASKISRFRVRLFEAPRNDELERASSKMTGPETLDVARDAIWTLVVVS